MRGKILFKHHLHQLNQCRTYPKSIWWCSSNSQLRCSGWSAIYVPVVQLRPQNDLYRQPNTVARLQHQRRNYCYSLLNLSIEYYCNAASHFIDSNKLYPRGDGPSQPLTPLHMDQAILAAKSGNLTNQLPRQFGALKCSQWNWLASMNSAQVLNPVSSSNPGTHTVIYPWGFVFILLSAAENSQTSAQFQGQGMSPSAAAPSCDLVGLGPCVEHPPGLDLFKAGSGGAWWRGKGSCQYGSSAAALGPKCSADGGFTYAVSLKQSTHCRRHWCSR